MKSRFRLWLTRVDAYAMDDPDNNEGHPEDRCSLCDRPTDRHPCLPHRILAALILKFGGRP